MKVKQSSTRYAHLNGYTFCTYSKDGKMIFTCGADGDLRVWEGFDDDDPRSSCLGEFVYCVVEHDGCLLSSGDLSVVSLYTLTELKREAGKFVFRFQSPATSIKATEKFIVAGSEDTEIKFVNVNDKTNVFELKGHEGPILHVDVNKNNLLASSAGDGTIKIWDLSEMKEIKSIDGFLKITEFGMAKCFVTPCFEPKNNNYLVYCNKNAITLMNCGTWNVESELKHPDVDEDFTCCAFSSCGKFLAAGTINGKLIVFDFLLKQVVDGDLNSDKSESITSISWNPTKSNEFIYCDYAGHLGKILIEDVNSYSGVSSGENDEQDDFANIHFDDTSVNGEDDENEENCISLEKLKNQTLAGYGLSNANEDDDNVSIKSDEKHVENVERCVVKTYNQQKSFQPGATPEDLEHRYMVWNNVGMIKAHKGSDDDSIDIEFHDVNVHHSLYMRNYLNHTMASLSSTVVALSSYNSSKLVCIALGAGSREWTVELPANEGIVAITATSELVAVATDNRFVRILTVMGTQREIISVPGPVVAMCGYENKLMIAYHSAPANEDQHISAILLQTFGLTLFSKEVRIPITPGKKLTYIGYSDRGSPVCSDTMGIIQMYNMKTCCWYPICETINFAKNVVDNFYIINVLESTQIIQGIFCRGCSYPMTNPRPIVIEIPIRLPMCDIESDKSKLEDTLIRYSNFSIDNPDVTIKETAVKLFALACRNEIEARAKELIETISSPEILSLAVKYATKLGRVHLADKLYELLPDIENQEKEREQQKKEANTDIINVIQKSTLNDSLIQKLKLTPQSLSSEPKTPTQQLLAPKPMYFSGKRNPFKKQSKSVTQSENYNPLSHLTEKLIGHDNKESQHNQSENMDIQSQELFTTKDNDETISEGSEQNQSKKGKNGEFSTGFVAWFESNEEKLKNQNPNATKKELTKIALTEFRQIIQKEKGASTNNATAVKRKLEESQSVTEKLAKYRKE